MSSIKVTTGGGSPIKISLLASCPWEPDPIKCPVRGDADPYNSVSMWNISFPSGTQFETKNDDDDDDPQSFLDTNSNCDPTESCPLSQLITSADQCCVGGMISWGEETDHFFHSDEATVITLGPPGGFRAQNWRMSGSLSADSGFCDNNRRGSVSIYSDLLFGISTDVAPQVCDTSD
jgi:hypothetical protein